MSTEMKSQQIQLNVLRSLQEIYHRDLAELIEMYLHDAKRKISNLQKAWEQKHYPNFTGVARELRLRSAEIGAIQFSHMCLAAEISIQEMRFEGIEDLLLRLEQRFTLVHAELKELINKLKQKEFA